MSKQTSNKFIIPDGTITVTPTVNPDHYKYFDDLFEDMRGNMKRDWFNNHAYFCLPLTVANQYGIAVKALQGFEAVWDGGPGPTATQVHLLDYDPDFDLQVTSTHFGMGTVTIQNHVCIQAPPFTNLYVTDAPNHFIHGARNMNAIIEADNLVRDFTFNLKLTQPGCKVTIQKGDIIGCLLPFPRYFVDSFTPKHGKDVFGQDYQEYLQEMGAKFAEQRNGEDRSKPHGNGRKYWKGEDAFGCPFHDHQIRVKKPKNI